MTTKELYQTLKDGLKKIILDNKLSLTKILIKSNSLTPEEAIGITMRKDFPILTGKEIMLQAEYNGSFGQAFTASPSYFYGNLEEIINMDIENDYHARGLFIATLNAVMKSVGLAQNTIHCKNGEPETCAEKMLQYIKENYKKPKIALVGYQPSFLETLSKKFDLRVLDLNPDNVGKIRYNVLVENGITDYEEVVLNWADLVLCTGSTLCNGSIVNFIEIGKEVIFFGTTLAGAGNILGLKRLCFCSK